MNYWIFVHSRGTTAQCVQAAFVPLHSVRPQKNLVYCR